MIDSIDNNMAAPSGEADFSGAVSPEAEALTEAAAQAVPLPSLLGEDGGFVPDWYARFDELKGMEKSLSKFKTPEALAKSYAELERLRHYPGVENEEQMARFRRMAGLPELLPRLYPPPVQGRARRTHGPHGLPLRRTAGSHERSPGNDGPGI